MVTNVVAPSPNVAAPKPVDYSSFDSVSPETYAELYRLRDPDTGKLSTEAGIGYVKQRASQIPTSEDMTPLDREVAKVSAEQWNRYQTAFVPFENKAIRDILTSDRFTPAVKAAVQANIFRSQPGIGDLARGGAANPSYLLTGQGSAIPLARALASGQVGAIEGIQDEKMAGMGNLVELGRGGGDVAASSLSKVAGQAAERAISERSYQYGLDALSQERRMDEKNYELAQSIRNQQLANSFLSSATGVGMWYADRGANADRVNGWYMDPQYSNRYGSGYSDYVTRR